jgi:hypothetical protein
MIIMGRIREDDEWSGRLIQLGIGRDRAEEKMLDKSPIWRIYAKIGGKWTSTETGGLRSMEEAADVAWQAWGRWKTGEWRER